MRGRQSRPRNTNYMTLRFSILLLLLTCTRFAATAQSVADALRHHVFYLADDSLEGRQSGSRGEQMAWRYIVSQFEKIGIAPLGTNGYLQPFTFTKNKVATENNRLYINNTLYRLYDDYYPLAYSATDSVSAKARYINYGIQSKKIKLDDYAATSFRPGEIAIINMGLPPLKKKNTAAYQQDFHSLSSRITLAEKNGAAAVIFIKNKPEDADADEWLDASIVPAKIPVIYLRLHVFEKFRKENTLDISLKTEIITPQKTAHNVIGFIDHQAPTTVVIGAHYDHLGYNEYRNAMHKGASAIHNGADDNASGVAMLIELARHLKHSSLTANNYLFIAFSGEELGLLGSNYFINNPTYELKKINYMLNYDMVGRLNEKKLLTVNGVGTSPHFSIVKNISIDSIQTQTTESGIGPSDHTSFYLKNIPVLHFFTGLHTDYHMPTDDAEKVNISGMESILKWSLALIDSLNKLPQIAFTKSKDNTHSNESASKTRFKVTLGIMPSYAYEGKGIKVEGVSENKPAAKAGLQQGDIIIQLGKNVVSSMNDYMKALSQFSKGDKTNIKVLRNGKPMTFKVQF